MSGVSFAIPAGRLTCEEHHSQKSEDNLAMAEAELDKQTNIVTDLTRKVDELQVKADEAARLKDQVDEYVSCRNVYLNSLRNLLGIDMPRTSCRKRRTSWRSTRRSFKRARTSGSMSRCVARGVFRQELN